MVWANPTPVTCVIQPVVVENLRIGFLVGKRGIPPFVGGYAFPGGFLEEETAQQGGARELLEEMGLAVTSDSLRQCYFESSYPRHNRVLLFSTGDLMTLEEVQPQLKLTEETTEIGLIFGTGGLDRFLCFPIHTNALKHALRWQREVPHDYMKLL
jgi:ADP-ribose pyrophosphatase YjhB (NUDIX family)